MSFYDYLEITLGLFILAVLIALVIVYIFPLRKKEILNKCSQFSCKINL